ncbi:uncharacterized protein [Gossypium hirsutum]|uniref:Uncharacterized protein n=1 Tax=Gossypium hirsutum TaxID=3635 RepID=A0ABM2ZR32_GOSHI|nr:uncharacterized protein LOC121214581 [Gossypium hirsutum]
MDHLKYMMESTTLNGIMARWKILLFEFDILYVNQKEVKESAIADFLASRALEDYEPLNFDFPNEDLIYRMQDQGTGGIRGLRSSNLSTQRLNSHNSSCPFNLKSPSRRIDNQKLSIVTLKSALFWNHLSISPLSGFSLVLSRCRFLLEFLQLQGLFRPDLLPLLCNLLFLSPQMAHTATQKIRRWATEHCEKTQGTLEEDVPWIQSQNRTEDTLKYSLAVLLAD